jgi:hypothetical protein
LRTALWEPRLFAVVCPLCVLPVMVGVYSMFSSLRLFVNIIIGVYSMFLSLRFFVIIVNRGILYDDVFFF